jgi:preprotein translocase subunit SecG
LWGYATLFNSYSALFFVSLGYTPAFLGLLAGLNAAAVFAGHWFFRNFQQTPFVFAYALAVALLIAMALPMPIVSVGAFLLQALLIGGLTAVFDRQKMKIFPDNTRATLLSTFNLSVQLMFIPISLAFGIIADYSIRTAFMVLGMGILVWLMISTTRHHHMQQSAS